MSYRDDHDAALARVAALEADLDRVTCERDLARDELVIERLHGAPPLPPPERRVSLAWPIAAIVLGTSVAIAVHLWTERPRTPIYRDIVEAPFGGVTAGELRAETGKTWVFPAKLCAADAHGHVAVGDRDRHVAVTANGTGPSATISLEADGFPNVTLSRSDCDLLEVDIRAKSFTEASPPDPASGAVGSIVADCRLPGGGRVHGAMAFVDCPVVTPYFY
jgi:hypothetical protein